MPITAIAPCRIDEKTGHQALERIDRAALVPAGRTFTEFEYLATASSADRPTRCHPQGPGVIGNRRQREGFRANFRQPANSAAADTHGISSAQSPPPPPPPISTSRIGRPTARSLLRAQTQAGSQGEVGVLAKKTREAFLRRPHARSSLFHAKACFLAQPDRDLVLYPGAQTASPGQLYLKAEMRDQIGEVHRLFNETRPEALPLGHDEKTAHRVRAEKMSPSLRSAA